MDILMQRFECIKGKCSPAHIPDSVKNVQVPTCSCSKKMMFIRKETIDCKSPSSYSHITDTGKGARQ